MSFDRDKLPALFNEWMRRYTEDPKAFAVEFQTITEFLREQAAGKEPSYGDQCVAYLEKLASEPATS